MKPASGPQVPSGEIFAFANGPLSDVDSSFAPRPGEGDDVVALVDALLLEMGDVPEEDETVDVNQ